jgi:hypothetical protein
MLAYFSSEANVKYIRQCRIQSCPHVISQFHLLSCFLLFYVYVVYIQNQLRTMSEQIRTYTNKKSAFINNCTARCGIFAF